LITFAQIQGDESALAAARIVEGLFLCLELPRERRGGLDAAAMGEAATMLNRLAQGLDQNTPIKIRFPARLNQRSKAEEALASTITNALADNANDERIARFLEMGRACYEHLGAMRILPHTGTEQERVELFADAIADLREARGNRTLGAKLIDAEDIVSACARACGFTGRLFEARRKKADRTHKGG
jgi:hypothetical protein